MKGLSIDDRFVRTTLQDCALRDAEIKNASRSIHDVKPYIHELMNKSVEVDKAHDIWSEFLSNGGFIIGDGGSIERHCAALKETFRCGP